MRSLRLAGEVTDEVTFLGAHVVPAEYAGSADDYVALVAGPMLTACAPRARWVDVFCEPGSAHAFDGDQARTVLEAGAAAGLGLRVHGNQLAAGPGVRLAVELGAASVDHCTHLVDADVDALAAGTTVATLLPTIEFSTRSPYPDARRLLDAGVTVALATDCNPGSGYSSSMQLAIALAVREMRMTPAEALWAATAGGARPCGAATSATCGSAPGPTSPCSTPRRTCTSPTAPASRSPARSTSDSRLRRFVGVSPLRDVGRDNYSTDPRRRPYPALPSVRSPRSSANRFAGTTSPWSTCSGRPMPAVTPHPATLEVHPCPPARPTSARPSRAPATSACASAGSPAPRSPRRCGTTLTRHPAAGPHRGPGRPRVPAPRRRARPAHRHRPADDRHVPAGAARADGRARRHAVAGAVHPHRHHDRPRPGPARARPAVRRDRPPQGAARRSRGTRVDVGAVRARPQHRGAHRRPGRPGRRRCRDLGRRHGGRPRPLQRTQGGHPAQPPHPRARCGADPGADHRRLPARGHQLARHLRGAVRHRGRAGGAGLLRPARDAPE